MRPTDERRLLRSRVPSYISEIVRSERHREKEREGRTLGLRNELVRQSAQGALNLAERYDELVLLRRLLAARVLEPDIGALNLLGERARRLGEIGGGRRAREAGQRG